MYRLEPKKLENRPFHIISKLHDSYFIHANLHFQGGMTAKQRMQERMQRRMQAALNRSCKQQAKSSKSLGFWLQWGSGIVQVYNALSNPSENGDFCEYTFIYLLLISLDKADKKARIEKESRQEQERMVNFTNLKLRKNFPTNVFSHIIYRVTAFTKYMAQKGKISSGQ